MTGFTNPDVHDLLSQDELDAADRRGIDAEEIAWQYETLRKPQSSLRLLRPATIGDGIVRLSESDEVRLDRRGAVVAARGDVTRFVPASGAATRMFADLAAALDDPAALERKIVRQFFDHMDEFAFAAEVRRAAGVEKGAIASDSDRLRVIAALLRRTGLGLGALPKGLVPFHSYDSGSRTAVAEHVREAALHCRDSAGVTRLHFTVPDGAQPEFSREIEAEANLAGLEIEYQLSVQEPGTDTLALDEDDRFFRDEDGALVWRPGGHGALLRNLSIVRTPYASIKNVDNVRREEDHEENARWKRIVTGLLDETRASMRTLRTDSDADIDRAVEWITSTFGRRPTAGQDPREFIRETQERPVRVCGVVRNEGEPGGAPFWVSDVSSGGESLQIVESSQVADDDPHQMEVFASSTHFNPVDIAVSLVDLDEGKIDLQRFVDRRAVFVASKSYGSRTARVLERPGLWNGAMAGWNTICVEVPPYTFTPVKTVVDLLRDGHRAR